MKLLEKNKIQELKTQERVVEVTEGAKLAKKIDNLRQMYADEQRNLVTFRNETIKNVQAEINTYFVQKEELQDEIYSLTEQKKELLIPLDRQWEKVHKKEEELIIFAGNLQKIFSDNAIAKQDIDIERQLLKEDQHRNAIDKAWTVKLLTETEEKNNKATSILAKTEETEKNVLAKLSKKEKALSIRESNISYAEIDIKNKNDNLAKEYQFISNTKIQLDSERKILERAIAKYKK